MLILAINNHLGECLISGGKNINYSQKVMFEASLWLQKTSRQLDECICVTKIATTGQAWLGLQAISPQLSQIC